MEVTLEDVLEPSCIVLLRNLEWPTLVSVGSVRHDEVARGTMILTLSLRQLSRKSFCDSHRAKDKAALD